jgi:hypothetical protein
MELLECFERNGLPPSGTGVDAEVDIEVLKTVPEAFAIDSEEHANWLVQKVTAARQYAERVKKWAEQELRRAEREEETLMFLFGRQIETWAKSEIGNQNGRRKSLALPAGTLGYRKLAAKLVIDDEELVLEWAKKNCEVAIVITERLSKSVLDEFFKKTGAIPDQGAHIDPEIERFYIK